MLVYQSVHNYYTYSTNFANRIAPSTKATQPGVSQSGSVVYWMSRDIRTRNNWALLYAQEQALARKVALTVVFAIRQDLIKHHGTTRLLVSLQQGLLDVSAELANHAIGLAILIGDPPKMVADFAQAQQASLIVTDFSPLKLNVSWRQELSEKSDYEVHTIDAHNIIPPWIAYPKAAFSARILRPKLLSLLPAYLTAFPPLKVHPVPSTISEETKHTLAQLHTKIRVDTTIKLPDWFTPGQKAGQIALKKFVQTNVHDYARLRNDPTKQHTSTLSPWLHFGMLSAAEIYQAVEGAQAPQQDKDAFLEELLIRRELAENFCYYNPNYADTKGYPQWAEKTLAQHAEDPREYSYNLEQLETAQTHDTLWNAAQKQMVKSGHMHGYMRMYWAKKIFEWSATVEQAHTTALTLNDTYQLDGRDPNGYTGVAWSMGGVHDRPWFERPIFGTVRYMNRSGAERKFDVATYCKQWL